MRDVLQNLKVEDVERSFRARFLQILKMEDFRARRPSKSESGRCENEAFVRDVLLILKGQLVKIKPELSVPLRGRSEHDPTLQKKVFRNRPPDKLPHPSTGKRFALQNTAFRASAKAICQKLISCETSFKK